MLKKVVIWYLKRLEEQTSFELMLIENSELCGK